MKPHSMQLWLAAIATAAGLGESDRHRAGRSCDRASQGRRRGSVHLRLPDDRQLRVALRVLHRHELGPVQGAVQPDLQRGARVHAEGHGDQSRPTATRRTRWSLLDLRAEPIVLCVPEIEKARYYAVQLVDLYTFNYGYIGSRTTGNGAGCYWSPAPTGRARRPRASRRSSAARREFSLVDLPHPALQPGRHRQREEGPGRLQGPAALRVPQPARAARRPGDRVAEDRARSVQPTPSPIPELPAAVLPAGGTGGSGKAAAGAVRQDRHRGRASRSRSRSSPPSRRRQLGDGHQGRRSRRSSKTAATVGKDVNGWRVGAAAGRPRVLQGRLDAARRRGHSSASTATSGRGGVSVARHGQRTATSPTAASTATR